jgi:AcrR family transcriptional regulator
MPPAGTGIDVRIADACSSTVRDRLIEAADRELAEYGTLTGRFEAVAHRAGVSRATAYRQLGSICELSIQVGLLRAQKYVRGMRKVMDRVDDALTKIEAAMVYAASELPNEPIVLDLISRPVAAIDPEVRQLITDVLWSALVSGQRAGQIRTDVDLAYVIDYLIEQSYLTTHARDRSECAVRRRFRSFIEPAIAPER